jgi:hypothetical protein
MKKIFQIFNQKNILTLGCLPFGELRRGNGFPFSKGEAALPRDEKGSPDFQAKNYLTLIYLPTFCKGPHCFFGIKLAHSRAEDKMLHLM